MRHTQILQAGGRWNVTAIGEYIHYEKGAGEIELEVDGEMHQLAVRDTFIMPEGYQGFKVLNLDSSAGEFSFLTGRGQLKVAASGQLTEVSGIASTVDVNLLNSVVIQSLPPVSVNNVVDIRPITETLNVRPITETLNVRTITETLNVRPITETLNVRPITETLKNRPDSGSVFMTDSFVIGASGSVSLTEKPLRKDVTILAEDQNTAEIFVNGLPLYGSDSFLLENFTGALEITGSEGDGFKILQVFYAA